MTAAPDDFNPHSPQALRGKKRLKALGLDLDTASAEQARQWYEAERERYLNLAEGGLHMVPGHSIYGMLVDALKSAHGWTETPDGWSDAQVTWPSYVERLRGERGN